MSVIIEKQGLGAEVKGEAGGTEKGVEASGKEQTSCKAMQTMQIYVIKILDKDTLNV